MPKRHPRRSLFHRTLLLLIPTACAAAVWWALSQTAPPREYAATSQASAGGGPAGNHPGDWLPAQAVEAQRLAEWLDASRRDARRRLASLQTVARHMAQHEPLPEEHAAELDRVRAEATRVRLLLAELDQVERQLEEVRQRLSALRTNAADPRNHPRMQPRNDPALAEALADLRRWCRRQELLAGQPIADHQWRPESTSEQEHRR